MFDIYNKELEVADLYFEHEMSLVALDDIYYEDGEGGNPGFFAKIKKAVCEFIDSVAKSISGLFENFTKKKSIEKAEEACAKNPKLRNAKVKVKDYSKVHVLSKKTQKAIANAKSKEEVDQIMARYKKTRNNIIGTAVATTAVITFAALLSRGKKGSKAATTALSTVKEETTTALTVYEKKATKKNEIVPVTISTHPLPDGNIEQKATAEDVNKAKAKATAEIARIEAKDTAEESKNWLMVIENPHVTQGKANAAAKEEVEKMRHGGKMDWDVFNKSDNSVDPYFNDALDERVYGKLSTYKMKVKQDIGALSEQERNLKSTIASLSKSTNSKKRNAGTISEAKAKLQKITKEKNDLKSTLQKIDTSRTKIRDNRGSSQEWRDGQHDAIELNSELASKYGKL